MSQSPVVSALMPTLNGDDYVEEGVRSILTQTYPHLEVLVVDGGSTDNTEKIVQGLAREDARVRFISAKGTDMAAARNLGLREARGELIALLDHDDLWMPQRLEKEVPLFENPDVALVHAAIEFFLMENDVKTTTYTYFSGENVGLTELLGHTVLGTQTLLFRRDLLEHVGGFDETMPYTSDWETCIGIAALGRVIGLPEVLGQVRMHTRQRSRNRREMFLQGMKALEKNRHHANGNHANRKAIRHSESELRQEYARNLKLDAVEAFKEKQIAQAIPLIGRALIVDRSRLMKILGRKLSGR